MATIRERRPGVWEIRIFTGRDANGRPSQSSRTFRGSKREAQKLAASLESRPGAKAGRRTVADVLDAWRDANAPVWSETSRRTYASRLALIRKDAIARSSLARLGVADVERWHTRMRAEGVGEAAIRTRHAALRAALTQAVRWEWIAVNPAANARLRQPRRAAREAMNADEVRAVLAAARTIDPLAELALRIAAVCGARRAEIAALRWDDVHDGRLVIDSSAEEHRYDDGTKDVVDAPTKTGGRRAVMLDERTLTDVEAHARVRAKVSPYMFSLDERPAPPARIGWWWTRARDLAGVDKRWRLHDLRHWSATVGITSGHDVRTVAGRLGHANPAMTLRVYAHAVEAADDALATTIGDVLGSDS
jgi:integrase